MLNQSTSVTVCLFQLHHIHLIASFIAVFNGPSKDDHRLLQNIFIKIALYSSPAANDAHIYEKSMTIGNLWLIENKTSQFCQHGKVESGVLRKLKGDRWEMEK
ncbi:unnamed protein product [Cuscuta epithymum]|uniref:Uncharacterized protein n=1 Tax=Cuscuta epithymum TaxID=186058 RepID=A0AAV0FMK3_9ASTE|nr:unnamed protein product [Cuscuta epithymum]